MPDSPRTAIADVLAAQRAARLAEGVPDAPARAARLQRVIDVLVDGHRALTAAVDADFGGRHPGYTLLNDVLAALGSLKHARDNVADWMAPQPCDVFAPYDLPGAAAHVRYQPKGTVGILGTWNAPLFTVLAPLASVLAAGNRAILKPSEVTPRTAQALAELFAAAIDPAEVAVLTGGPALAEALTLAPLDHLVFTGSAATGRTVLRNAAANLVPVTLELGGKCPVIVSRSADLALAAERVAIAKATNGGQLCVTADLVYVPREHLDGFAADLARYHDELLPTIAGNPDAVAIVNDAQHARIRGLLDDAAARGVRIATTGDAGTGGDRRLPLHVVIDPPADAQIMAQEIFGPAVVLLGYDTIEQVLADVNGRSHPLALYYFGTDEAEQRAVLDGTLSGGVTINDLILHAGLADAPFGGVGGSGMGHYQGRAGFLAFSHARLVLQAATVDVRRAYALIPPYPPGYAEMLAGAVSR